MIPTTILGFDTKFLQEDFIGLQFCSYIFIFQKLPGVKIIDYHFELKIELKILLIKRVIASLINCNIFRDS